MIRKRLLIAVIIICLIIQIPFASDYYSVAAQTPPPVNGSWVISDSTTITGQTIMLNGSLIIQNSGTLNLNNCILILNNNATKNYGIYIEGNLFGGGTFNLENTEIRSNNSQYYYTFTVNGSSTMNMKGCTIRNLGGIINVSDPLSSLGGIQIHSSNVMIEDTYITDYQTIGVMVMPYAAPTIRRCNISLPLNLSGPALSVGIVDSSTGIVSPEYSDNYISGNSVSGLVSVGVPVMSNFAEITGNIFKNNTVGVTCWGTDPDILNNDFSGNVLSSIALVDSNAEVAGNEITISGSAISVLNPGTPQIHNNFINFSANAILLMNGSSANIYQNNISDNLLYGISAINSNPTVNNNDFNFNLGGAIYLDSSDAGVSNNKIFGGENSRGVIVLNDSNPDIRSNFIFVENGSIGIILNGNGTGAGNISNNNIQVTENAVCIEITGFGSAVNNNVFTIGKNSRGMSATTSTLEFIDNYFLSDTGSYGATIQYSSGLLQNNRFNNLKAGILLENCIDIALNDNTFNQVNDNEPDEHRNFEMEAINSSGISADLEPSYLRLLNSTYADKSLSTGSIFQVDWFLDVYTKKYGGSPASGAAVDLKNQSGNKTESFITDQNGEALWKQITEKIYYSDRTVSHSPYTIRATLGDESAKADLELTSSKSISLTLGPNLGPSKPFNITPVKTHSLTPEIKWNKSIDPEEDKITYKLSIGTSPGAKDILSDYLTTDNNYTVKNALEFRQYYITISANTPDGNSSGTVSTVMDVYNTPPVLQSIENMTIILDVNPTLNFFLNGSDNDTDPVDKLSYNTTTTFENFTLDKNTGEVKWTASKKYLGNIQMNFSVTDGYVFVYQTLNIYIGYQNIKPVAVTNKNLTAYVGDTVYLNGSGSYDPDGYIVDYVWSVAGPDILNTSDPIRPWFIPPSPGNYSFLLHVIDNNGSWSLPSSVYVVVLPANQKPPEGPPRLTLRNVKVTPERGSTDENYIFKITVFGENVTQQLIDIIEDSKKPLIQLKLDNKLTLDALRKEEIYNLDVGITYTVEVPGTMIGPGEHTFRFICNFENVGGDLGEHAGPVITDKKKSDEDKGFESSTWLILIAIVIIIIVILIFFFITRKKGSEEELPPPPPPPPAESTIEILEDDIVDNETEWDEE